MEYSDDQAVAFDAVAEALLSAGIDLKNDSLLPQSDNKNKILAILGKAGSGKTLLLANLAESLINAGVELISGDYEGKPRKDRRTLAILAPTNKAASVLRNRGVQATTIHRILYTPMYDPEYEKFSEWLNGNDERPVIEGLNEISLDRAALFFKNNKSIPGALAAAGLRGSDFIIGWKRREEPLDIGPLAVSPVERVIDPLKPPELESAVLIVTAPEDAVDGPVPDVMLMLPPESESPFPPTSDTLFDLHSGLPLRAKTGIYSYSAKLLAPGLAGARRNPFWVYFWLKSARGRRSKKMAVFFMVKGPIFGHFSPNLDLRRPKCRENSERPRFRPLSGHFSGG